ncbi:MAG: transcriptional repressor [Chlorobium sp.]|uniref:Fur family transcriptional regulator n=1 Tax=Chlorobium sp. TaxID=1095 RepID=UPI002F427699
MRNAPEIIRKAGLKVTPVRLAILRLLSDSVRPLSPRDVHDHLMEKFGRNGLPGVYRNLEALAESGILFRIPGFGRERRYALCPNPDNPHQHHIICISCGRISEIEECRYHDGMMVGGYRLLSHAMQFEGICGSCLSQTNHTRS